MDNSNLYIGESCGTCAHSEVCIHRIKCNNVAALGIVNRAAPELPEPFKVRLFCSKYKSRSIIQKPKHILKFSAGWRRI